MKRIPRGEISTAKDLIYPQKKPFNKAWHMKNLKSIKEQEEKNRQMREKNDNYIQPEPYKMKEFKNVQSKLYEKTKEWVSNEQELNAKQKPKMQSPERKPIPQREKLNYNPQIGGNDNIYNYMYQNESNTMFDKYYQDRMKNKQISQVGSKAIKIDEYENNRQLPLPLQQNEENIFPKEQQEIQKTIEDNQEDPKLQELLREYKENQRKLAEIEESLKNDKLNEEQTIQSKRKQQIKGPTPKYNENPLILPKIQRNYLMENKKIITEHKVQPKSKPKTQVEPAIHKNYGKTPEYLEKFKKEAEIKKELIQRKKEEAKYPNGTKLLSEEERVSTLNGLINTKKEINNILEKMPITTRTLAVQNKKDELIRKLEEIDKAIDMFSKKQVFVKIQ